MLLLNSAELKRQNKIICRSLSLFEQKQKKRKSEQKENKAFWRLQSVDRQLAALKSWSDATTQHRETCWQRARDELPASHLLLRANCSGGAIKKMTSDNNNRHLHPQALFRFFLRKPDIIASAA